MAERRERGWVRSICGYSAHGMQWMRNPAKNQKRLPIPSRTAAGTGFKSQIKPQNDISFNM
jgi:hypothetical protein